MLRLVALCMHSQRRLLVSDQATKSHMLHKQCLSTSGAQQHTEPLKSVLVLTGITHLPSPCTPGAPLYSLSLNLHAKQARRCAAHTPAHSSHRGSRVMCAGQPAAAGRCTRQPGCSKSLAGTQSIEAQRVAKLVALGRLSVSPHATQAWLTGSQSSMPGASWALQNVNSCLLELPCLPAEAAGQARQRHAPGPADRTWQAGPGCSGQTHGGSAPQNDSV